MNLDLLKKLNIYQLERFPLIILGPTLYLVALSSASVSHFYASDRSYFNPTVIIAFFQSLLYILHIRLMDDLRDLGHDNLFHEYRPIQRGLISRSIIRKLDFVVVTLFIVLAHFGSFSSIFIMIFLLLYTFIASREFFAKDLIKSKFLIYNKLNILQMLILQIYIYSFLGVNSLNSLIVYHFIFTSMGTLILEIMRKVKIPSEESKGNDTYTARYGIKKTLYSILILMIIWGGALFYFTPFGLLLIGIPIILNVICLFFVNKTIVNLLQLSILLFYAIGNILIFYAY